MAKLKAAFFALLVFIAALSLPLCARAEQKRTITMLVKADSPPYAYFQDGEFRGISVEILRAVFSRTPYELELAEPTKAQLSALTRLGESGEAGFYPPISESGSFVRSDPLFTLSHCLYTRRGFGHVSTANAMSFNVGVRNESYLVSIARSHLGVSGFVPYSSAKDGVEMLTSGEIDVLFDEQAAVDDALDALSARDYVTVQQKDLFTVPVSIALPDYMADMMDDINARVAQVSASGALSRLLGAQDQPAENFDMQGGNIVMPFAVVGVAALLAVVAVLIARASLLTRLTELEGIAEAFPLLGVDEKGAVTYFNKPMKALMGEIRPSVGKSIPESLRFVSAKGGEELGLFKRECPDALLLNGDAIIWRGSIRLARPRPIGRTASNALIGFYNQPESEQKRGYSLLNSLLDAQGSFTALCQGIFEHLEKLMLANAMAVYTIGDGGLAPLFSTHNGDSALESMCARLYGAVSEQGILVLSPEDITVLAARCGVRYNDSVRFIAAPLTTSNTTAGMLWLRVRLDAAGPTQAQLEFVSALAWRMSGMLARFDSERQELLARWYSQDGVLPNGAYFEQLLAHVCAEPVSAPVSVQARFKGAPDAAAVALVKIWPCTDDLLIPCADSLKAGAFCVARVDSGKLGLLIPETNVKALGGLLEAMLRDLSAAANASSIYIGAARYPFDSLSARSLLEKAELALNRAAENGFSIFGG